MDMKAEIPPAETRTPFSWGNPYAWPRKPLFAANIV